MSKIQEYQEVIEFLNYIKLDATPQHEKSENEIPQEYYEKILRSTRVKIDF